jgi:phospholipid/cholesterol/gamma-HCH transport system ATP-binding protein
MISAVDLHKSFDGLEVLKGASLEVERGEAVAMIGPSGDGKSVFLKHIAGLMQPDRGHVTIDGLPLAGLGGRKLRALRSRLGFLFQGGALFQSMTIYDNVAFPLRERTRMPEKEIRERVTQELADVGLTGSEAKFPAQISGGMVKRAALARALVQSPEIILFDEPTTGLDPIIGHAINHLIYSCQQRRGLTAIIVSHDVPYVFRIVDKVALLEGGRIVFAGTPEEIMTCDDPAVRAFVDGTIVPGSPAPVGADVALRAQVED